MNGRPEEVLRAIVAQYSPSVCDDPRRFKSLLHDLYGGHPRDINILVAALEEHVAADLRASHGSVPLEVTLARLIKRLQDNRALAPDAAQWAVHSWAVALGVISLHVYPDAASLARALQQSASSSPSPPRPSHATSPPPPAIFPAPVQANAPAPAYGSTGTGATRDRRRPPSIAIIAGLGAIAAGIIGMLTILHAPGHPVQQPVVVVAAAHPTATIPDAVHPTVTVLSVVLAARATPKVNTAVPSLTPVPTMTSETSPSATSVSRSTRTRHIQRTRLHQSNLGKRANVHYPSFTLYVDSLSQGFTGANLRARPSTSAPIEVLVRNGVRVKVTGHPARDKNGQRWYSVMYGSRRGYILDSLLRRHAPQSLAAMYVNAAPYIYTGVVVRTRPSINASVVVGVDNGTVVQVRDKPLTGSNGEDWYIVQYGQQVGYARAKLFSRDKPQPMTPMYVDASSYNYTGIILRTRPSLNADAILGANNGALVQVLDQPVSGDNGENWYIVEYQHRIGYARAKLLNAQQPPS